MAPSPAPTDSALVRGQLVTCLELELIGPTQRVLRALGPDGEGLDSEALDRLPSSWYPTGFLVPSETDLSLKCDDTADDDLPALMVSISTSPTGPTPTTNRDRVMTAAAANPVRPGPSSSPPPSVSACCCRRVANFS